MDRAPAHEAREFVAELLELQRPLDDLGVRGGQREDGGQPDVVRRGQHVEVRGVVLQEGPVDEKLAKKARALGHPHAQRRLDRLDRGDHMVRRADAADAGRDQRGLVEAAADDHGFEEARGLDDVEADLADHPVLDVDRYVAVALDAGHVIDCET